MRRRAARRSSVPSTRSDAHRDAVRLRIVDGLDYPEIALQLRCTETTARKWVSLGLRGLRTRMEVAR
jgi:DNA-directed RNA polymerase specialized sigma24 family protein